MEQEYGEGGKEEEKKKHDYECDSCRVRVNVILPNKLIWIVKH